MRIRDYVGVMHITDPAIINAIKQIADHYQKNVSNRFTARALSSLPSDAGTHSLLVLFTEQLEDYQLQGLYLEDLYVRMLAAAKLVQQIRTQIMPNIRSLVFAGAPIGQGGGVDKAYRDMAATNFGPNLNLYFEKLKELYVLVVDYDVKHAGNKPLVGNRFPELGKYLRD